MGNKSNTVKRKKNYNEYTVMLVGKMGAGKSSLGNFLLQREEFVTGDDMSSVTNDNRCESRMITDKIKLRIIDTPGFGDFREDSGVFSFFILSRRSACLFELLSFDVES